MNKRNKYPFPTLPAKRALLLLLLFPLCLFTTQISYAQGWYRTFPLLEGQSVVPTTDNGFLIAGRQGDTTFVTASDNAFFTRVDADGKVIWSNQFGGSQQRDDAFSVVQSDDGGFVAGGSTNSFGPNADMFVFKSDKDGNEVWTNHFGGPNGDRVVNITNANDGGYLVTGCFDCFNVAATSQLYIVRLDPNGNSIWARTYNLAEEGYGAVATNDGGFAIAAIATHNDTVNINKLVFLKIDSDGNTLWNKTIGNDTLYNAWSIAKTTDGFALAGSARLPGRLDSDAYLILADEDGNNVRKYFYGGTENEIGFDVLPTSDGGYALTGLSGSDGDVQYGDLFITKADAQGNLLWERYIGNDIWQETGKVLAEAPDKSLFVIGTRQIKTGIFTSTQSEVLFVKTDQNGLINDHLVNGRVSQDVIANCEVDAAEPGLGGWVVKADDNTNVQYTTTNDSGYYELLLTEGNYILEFIAPNTYWSACTNAVPISISGNQIDTITTNVAYQADTLCANLSIDISTDQLSPCTESVYHIKYENWGTNIGTNSMASIQLDESITLIRADLPFTQNGNTYNFALGNLPIGVKDSFSCTVLLDCNAIVGETHCLQARIQPDAICERIDPAWDQSSLELSADCINDSIRIQARNIGSGNMAVPRSFIIIEDQIVDRSGSLRLDQNETFEVRFAPKGSTVHFKSLQADGHLGKSQPSVSLEGCGLNISNDFSRGFVTMHAEDDANSFVSIDCQESVNALNTYEKRPYPKGVGTTHRIYANTDIEYHIHYQNTTGDTIHRLVLRDSLSPFLIPETTRPGSASHAYSFDLYDQGYLRFTFDSLELLNGQSLFVKYRISQMTDIPDGSLITNQTSISPGYEPPINNDTIFHQIGVPQVLQRSSNAFCEGTIYRGNPILSDTIFRDTVLTVLYDSISRDSVVALATYTSTTTARICQGEQYEFQGLVYNQTNVYAFPMTSKDGCDSLLILDLTVLPLDSTQIDTSIQQGHTYNDVPYFSDTSFVENYTGSNGCDSLVFVNLSVLTTTYEQDKRLSSIDVQPNPSKDQFGIHLDVTEVLEIEISVRDLLGQTVLTILPMERLFMGEHYIPVRTNGLAAGTYYVLMKTDQSTYSQKIIVIP